jgi:F-box-like
MILELPTEILELMLDPLGPSDRGAAARVCRRLRAIIKATNPPRVAAVGRFWTGRFTTITIKGCRLPRILGDSGMVAAFHATSKRGWTLNVWNMTTLTVLRSFQPVRRPGKGCTFAVRELRDGRWVGVLATSKELKIFPLVGEAITPDILPRDQVLRAPTCAWTPDGRAARHPWGYTISGAVSPHPLSREIGGPPPAKGRVKLTWNGSQVRVWRGRDGEHREVVTIPLPSRLQVRDVAFSRDPDDCPVLWAIGRSGVTMLTTNDRVTPILRLGRDSRTPVKLP